MNAKIFAITATALLFATTSAMAQRATYRYAAEYQSPLTRAEVTEDAIHAMEEGLIPNGDQNVVLEPTGPGLTRAQVVAEMLAARRMGLLPRGQVSPIATPAQRRAIREAGLKALAEFKAASR